jgi:hypothetical protein
MNELKIGGMVWRRRIFWGLAIISLLFILGGLGISSEAYDQTVTKGLAENTYALGTTAREAYDAGTVIGAGIRAGIGMSASLCISGFLFLVFALLAWRNGAGIRTAKRHHEQIQAIREGRG